MVLSNKVLYAWNCINLSKVKKWINKIYIYDYGDSIIHAYILVQEQYTL